MSRTLRRIAAIGLGGGLACLTIAYGLGGPDIGHALGGQLFAARPCGSGVGGAAERHLPWNGGDRINVALAATVRLRGHEGSDVIVRGSPDIVEHVEFRDHRLALDCRLASASGDIEVSVPTQALRNVGISGSATVTVDKLNQPDLGLTINGSGTLQARGSVDRLAVALAGSGHARLGEVASKQLTVKVSGSGTVEASAREDADVSISGSGNVRLLSRPARLKTHIAGSGRLHQPPTEATDGKT